MTYTISLTPETEAVIARRAARRGMTIAGYMAHMADLAARKRIVATLSKRKLAGSRLTDEEYNALLSAMSLPHATPIPTNVDIRELAYDGVGE
jgi:hypothetical protein